MDQIGERILDWIGSYRIGQDNIRVRRYEWIISYLTYWIRKIGPDQTYKIILEKEERRGEDRPERISLSRADPIMCVFNQRDRYYKNQIRIQQYRNNGLQ